MRPGGARATPILAALAAAVALLALAFSQVTIRSDLAAFLPAGRTPAAQAMFAEWRQGAATGLVLLGIEGASAPELARTSRALAAALVESGRFRRVAGGKAAFDEAEAAALFERRYLLSPAIRPEAFAPVALRAGLERVLDGLRGSAAPLVARFGLPDPVSAFPALLERLQGSVAFEMVDGAWFAPGRERAILLAVLRDNGLDLAAQEAALATIREAFAATAVPGARLLLAGPAVLARDAARTIRGDVERIAVMSTLLVVALLAWRFRSALVLAAIGVPVLLSIAAAVTVTGLAFGTLHGIALGFGLTMLGITVDYPVLLIGHRKRGEAAPATRARIGGAFRLAVATATLGLGGLWFSGFPGLAQLGVFAATGLLAAAAATWWLLPPLVVAANLAPVAAGEGGWVDRLPNGAPWFAWAVALGAALTLVAVGGPHREVSLDRLSPVPAASQALDAALREAVGAAEAGQFLHVSGVDAETVLRRQEALLPRLDTLVIAGRLAGYEAAATLLPSVATQAARQAALPDPVTLAADVAQGAAGLGFRAAALRPFLDAVEASRTMPPWRPADLDDTALGARLGPLLFGGEGAWHGPILLRGLADRAALAVLEGPDVTFVAVREELDGLLAEQAGRAVWWLGGSALAILGVLVLGLRRPGRIRRVVGAVAAAQLVTVTVLTLADARLSPIHLVALLLVAGVGLDYALFFAREKLDGEERARTLRTLVTCNAMTLLTFGLLATCATPLLRDLGATVAVGAALSLGFGFLLARPPA